MLIQLFLNFLTTKEFIYSPKDLEKKLKTIIQTKLKTVARCYSVKNFELNKEQKTFSYNRNHKVNGIIMDYKPLCQGSYEIFQVNQEIAKIKISVF